MSGPTNPAVRRLVRRELARHRGRTALLFLLIAVPLTISVFTGIALASSGVGLDRDRIDVRGSLGLPDADVADVAAEIDQAVTEAIPEARTILWTTVQHRIGSGFVTVAGVPTEHPLATDAFPVIDGRMPGPGEMAMSPELLARLDIELGDVYPWVGEARPVVGVVGDDTGAGLIVVPLSEPAALGGAPRWYDYAVDAGGRNTNEAIDILSQRDLAVYVTEPFDADASTNATFVAIALMTIVALVSAAAWAAGVRRRLREAGLAMMNGAERRQVAGIVVGQALAIAMIAGTVALGSAIAISLVLARLVPGLYGHNPLRFDIGAMMLPVLVGVVSALLAAWWPARMLARRPVAEALAGRLPTTSVRRSLMISVPGLIVGGLGLVALNGLVGMLSTWSTVAILVTGALSALAVIVALASLIPATLHAVSRLMGRASPLLRLVARDGVRHPTRTALAATALIAVFAVPSLIMLDIADQRALDGDFPASEVPTDEVDLPIDAALVQHPSDEARTAAVRELTEIGAIRHAEELAYRSLFDEPGTFGPGRLVMVGPPTAAMAELIQSEALLYRSGHILTVADAGEYEQLRSTAEGRLTVVVLAADIDAETRQALIDHPLVQYSSDDPLSPPSWLTAERIFVGIALLLALLIAGSMTALTGAEAETDLATIVAIGAPASMRRIYLSLQTLYQAGLAMVLGVLGAVPVHLVTVNSTASLEVPPLLELGLLMGIPFVLAAGVWLVTRPLGGSVVPRG